MRALAIIFRQPHIMDIFSPLAYDHLLLMADLARAPLITYFHHDIGLSCGTSCRTEMSSPIYRQLLAGHVAKGDFPILTTAIKQE